MTVRSLAWLCAAFTAVSICGRAAFAADPGPPDPERDFNAKAELSARRAADMLPFLVDHPDLLRALREKIEGQRSAADDAVNPAPAVAQQRIITISPGTPGPVNEIDTMQGYPTTISFIDVTGARWPLHWEEKPRSTPSRPRQYR
jgi:Putative outer membrane core complex of type IVb secretion